MGDNATHDITLHPGNPTADTLRVAHGDKGWFAAILRSDGNYQAVGRHAVSADCAVQNLLSVVADYARAGTSDHILGVWCDNRGLLLGEPRQEPTTCEDFDLSFTDVQSYHLATSRWDGMLHESSGDTIDAAVESLCKDIGDPVWDRKIRQRFARMFTLDTEQNSIGGWFAHIKHEENGYVWGASGISEFRAIRELAQTVYDSNALALVDVVLRNAFWNGWDPWEASPDGYTMPERVGYSLPNESVLARFVDGDDHALATGMSAMARLRDVPKYTEPTHVDPAGNLRVKCGDKYPIALPTPEHQLIQNDGETDKAFRRRCLGFVPEPLEPTKHEHPDKFWRRVRERDGRTDMGRGVAALCVWMSRCVRYRNGAESDGPFGIPWEALEVLKGTYGDSDAPSILGKWWEAPAISNALSAGEIRLTFDVESVQGDERQFDLTYWNRTVPLC